MRPPLCFIWLFFIAFFAYGQGQKAGDPKICYTRISFGPAIGFYGNNPFHTANTRAGIAIGAQALEEVRLPKNMFFVGGLEYMYSTFMFNSYYFPNNSQPMLYTDKFTYNYSLKVHELRLNLLLRYPFGNETRNSLTGYIEGGYVLRGLVLTHLNIISDLNSQPVFNGAVQPSYNGVMLGGRFSSGLKINIGLQHNFLRSHMAWFAQISYMQGLAKFLIQESFTPSALYISSGFLQFSVGYKF
ncbi:MAG: hypothetical protein JST67_08690 [Bacteroidetes bacterium]|nr:hypothetical protein [Bacteroidota bacterium]